MDTKDDKKYVKYLRSQLVRGEQMEIAEELGYSYSHVKGVLMGYYKNDDIIASAERRVYARMSDTVIRCAFLLDNRPDLLSSLFQTLMNGRKTQTLEAC